MEEPRANGAYITRHPHPHGEYGEYPRRKGRTAQINPKRVTVKQISFKRLDDNHKENTAMLINFN